MLFHFNPKLCLNLIEELVNSSRVPGTETFKHSDVDISPWSNGDKATCDEQVLNVTVIDKSDKNMQLSWNNFRATLADKRQLLGYVISYIEAPYKNVSYFDRRDACGGDGYFSFLVKYLLRVLSSFYIVSVGGPQLTSLLILTLNLKKTK